MRHISRVGNEPDPEWLARAADLLEQLKAASDADVRNDIIDDNSNVWGDLKEWLLALSHGKCWFSEAKDCFSHWDVEHYRPKKVAKDADGTVHDGYWWLAFDWMNLRICGNAGNRKKATFFPLRAGCARCVPLRDLRFEDPQLLDPSDEDDPALLSFDFEGKAIAAPHVTDEWERERVEYSINRYKLDFPPLADKRKVTWAECWGRLQDYLKELAAYQADKTNVIAKESYKQAAKHVREMIREDKELSAIARACILGTGDPRVVGLLQTA